jgi:hypothetical protein
VLKIKGYTGTGSGKRLCYNYYYDLVTWSRVLETGERYEELMKAEGAKGVCKDRSIQNDRDIMYVVDVGTTLVFLSIN